MSQITMTVNQNQWVVGADLGATKIALGLISPENKIVASQRIPTDSQHGPQDAVVRMTAAVHAMETEIGVRAAALGVCSPGPVDHIDGLIIDPPNLHASWHHQPFRQMLADALQIPVVLEHDAKAAGLGEFYFGAGRGARDMVFVIVGTGVGAAIILDGQLYRGRHNSAGEVGHITINRFDRPGTSGVPGNVESYISGPALVASFLNREGAKRAKQELPSNGEVITQLAQQGDQNALAVFADAGDALAACVATVAMMMDIDLFVIGASVSKAGDLLLEPARAAVHKYGFKSVTERVRIEVTQLHDSGAILGCGWQARQLIS